MRNGVCPLCEGTEIVVPRGMRDSGRYQFLAAVSVLVKPHSVEPVDPVGVFVPFICRRCGYTQLFTAGADQIPIGPEYDTELVEGPGQGPADGPIGVNYT
jgi:hypothetical protein